MVVVLMPARVLVPATMPVLVPVTVPLFVPVTVPKNCCPASVPLFKNVSTGAGAKELP